MQLPTVFVTVTVQIKALVSPASLAGAFSALARERCGQPDDGSCDWFADAAGTIYIPCNAVMVAASHVSLS